jgi:predicted small lipoprotein YifL
VRVDAAPFGLEWYDETSGHATRRPAKAKSGGAPVALNDRKVLPMTLILGLVAAVSLSACGRKGPLEAPPAATATATDASAEEGKPPKPDKDFILDPLLD